jgi:hypothetical protein
MRAPATALVLALAACGQIDTPAPVIANIGGTTVAPHVVMATLARTACFGLCPVYTVTVYRDGVVEYDGEDHVKVKGKATGKITPDEVAALDQLFATNHYFDLKPQYKDYEVTDNPSSSTSYARGDQHHAVEHYHGDSHAPEELRRVEDGIDAIVHVEQWIGTEQEREKGVNAP